MTKLRLLRRALLSLSIGMLVPLSVESQYVSGVLMEKDEATPARGVLVRASDVRSGRMISSARTAEDGSFRVRIGGDSVRLEALRVGARPERLGELRTNRNVQGLRYVLRSDPIELPPIGTLQSSRCGTTDPASARLAATLFDQARTALSADFVSDSTTRVQIRRRRVALTADGYRELTNRVTDTATAVVEGPRTRVVAQLYRAGFYERDFERHHWYFAPTAPFFLDERFLQDYCLYLAGDAAGSPDEIGVGFHASRRRGVSQLSGTFWFKRDGLQLLRLTFAYDNVPREALEGKPGGVLEFTPFDDGRLLTSRWEVRMPQLVVESRGERPSGQGRSTSFEMWNRLTGIFVYSGEITSLSSGGVLLLSPTRD